MINNKKNLNNLLEKNISVNNKKMNMTNKVNKNRGVINVGSRSSNGGNKNFIFVVFIILFVIGILIYLFNTLTLAQTGGVFTDTREERRPRPDHRYILRSVERSTWFPPWFGNRPNQSPRCLSGCAYTRRPQDRQSNGWSCPNGPQCFSENCCKYDRQCARCGNSR